MSTPLCRILAATLAATAAFASTAAIAGCGDRPGTPTNVKAVMSGRDNVSVSWTNTATEKVWWDVQITDGQGHETSHTPRAGVGRGDEGRGLRVSNLYSIDSGETLCFRVKARTGPYTDGCVSERWSNQACVTAPDCRYGADTCAQGFVWREASSDDHVCVTPAMREQARADNAQAGARRSPGGGAYGPDTCLQGFVWREASPNDHVCVVPATRTQAASDNAQARSRVACR